MVIKERERERLVGIGSDFIIVWYEDQESLVYHYWRVRLVMSSGGKIAH
jgi:hypothetical protein